MEYELLGSESTGPTLSLDHEQFAYAGKFVMSSTGKTVVREDGELIGAVAFSDDHARDRTVRLRYVTVREDRRGEGVGPRLLRFTSDRLSETYEEVLIASNNPIAYQACYRAGFVYTGEQTGIAEVLLRYQPTDRETQPYREGLAVFQNRELPAEHERILDDHADSEPPAVVSVPDNQ